jgi:hypothetical protein
MSASAAGVPAPNKTHTVEQPNGVTFEAKQWGDECYSGWETAEGYTIQQNRSGYWLYLTKENGSIEQSNSAVEIDPLPNDTRKHLRRNPPERGCNIVQSTNKSSTNTTAESLGKRTNGGIYGLITDLFRYINKFITFYYS